MKVYKCYLLLNVEGMKKFPFNKKERSECSVDARENIFITGETMHAIEWYTHTLAFTQLPFFLV